MIRSTGFSTAPPEREPAGGPAGGPAGASSLATILTFGSPQFFHHRQPPSKLQTSPINLREWISRLWVLCGKPIRVKLWFRLNVWMKRLYLKNLAVVARNTAGAPSGCCC
ncbi:hypothetical protein EMIT0P171_20204 [Pseudomonas sp. IT-P171]